MAAPHGNNLLPDAGGERPSAAQELQLHFYNLCLLRHLSALDAEIVWIQRGYSSGLPDETRAKRERIYKEFKRNLQQLQDLYDGKGNASAASAVDTRASK